VAAWIREGIRDESDVSDLDDFSLPSEFIVLTVGRGLVTYRKAKRVKWVAPEGGGLIQCPPCFHVNVVVLEITVRVIAVIFSAFAFIDGLGEIFRLSFCKRSGKYFKEITSLAIH